MRMTTAFAIILGTVNVPPLALALAGDGNGLSFKDTPVSIRDTFRHEAARLAWRRARCTQAEATRPLVCEATASPSGAPGRKSPAPGAR
jgi:hypothetical protein